MSGKNLRTSSPGLTEAGYRNSQQPNNTPTQQPCVQWGRLQKKSL